MSDRIQKLVDSISCSQVPFSRMTVIKPMDQDKDFKFAKLTPENIVINYIFDMENGDFGILDEVKSALHQQIALELIKIGQGKLLADNLDKFKNLDKRQIAESIIESGDNFLAKQISDISTDIDIDDIGKLIDKL